MRNLLQILRQVSKYEDKNFRLIKTHSIRAISILFNTILLTCQGFYDFGALILLSHPVRRRELILGLYQRNDTLNNFLHKTEICLLKKQDSKQVYLAIFSLPTKQEMSIKTLDFLFSDKHCTTHNNVKPFCCLLFFGQQYFPRF